MPSSEPSLKRAIVFIDGQNLHYAVKSAFGYVYPNYDVKLLAEKICSTQGWKLEQIRFYTGVPDINDDVFWHNFWTRKLAVMGQKGGYYFFQKIALSQSNGEVIQWADSDFSCGARKGHGCSDCA